MISVLCQALATRVIIAIINGTRSSLSSRPLDRGEASALVAYKLDRSTGSVASLGELLDRYFAHGKAALHSVSEQVDMSTAGGRMVLNILTTIAQWEREVICERTTMALAHKRARGERVGSIPYGMRLGPAGRTLEPEPGEQETITATSRLRREGLSLRGIAAEPRREGMRARKGGEFTAAAVPQRLEPTPRRLVVKGLSARSDSPWVGSIARCESPTFAGVCTSEGPWCTDRPGWLREAEWDREPAPSTIPGPLPCRSRPQGLMLA